MVRRFSFFDCESEPFQNGSHFTTPDIRFPRAKVIDDGGDFTTHMTPQVVSVQKKSSKSFSRHRGIGGCHHDGASYDRRSQLKKLYESEALLPSSGALTVPCAFSASGKSDVPRPERL